MAHTTLIFDKYEFPEELQKCIHIVATEGYGLPNDCYFSWEIGDTEAGLEYITDEQVKEINSFLLMHGGKKGQEVLIKNWW